MPKLDESEFQAIVAGLIEEAEYFTDQELSELRAAATLFYQGKVDVEAEQGRSQMVSKDVRDTVMAMLPSIMRVFFSSERAVEYMPTGPEDEAVADQATDYANYLINQENDGYSIMYATCKDALIRACGVVKVWWEEKEESITERYTGIDEATLEMVQMEADTDVEVLNTTFEEMQMVDPQTGQPTMMQIPFFDAKVTKRMKKGRIRISEMPGEEVIVAREDKYFGESFIGHRTYMTVSDLVAMGYDRELVEANAQQDEFPDNPEWIARTEYAMYETTASANNPAMRKVLYVEGYCKIDRNGDGIAEHLKVCTIGTGYVVVDVEEVDDHPFVAFTCDPEAHVSPFEGSSPAEDVMDIQRVKSAIWRNTLDSAAQALNPRMVVIEGQANVQDVMNNEVGGIIRARSQGAVTPMVSPDLTATGLNMLTYADEVKESRTGMSKAAMGLDPDALRGTAVNAANAVVTATQSRLELVTRNLANGYKELFKKLLRLTVKHQDQPKLIRLRNEWVQVDPRSWNAQMDVTINVALGTGTNAEKFNVLAGIAQKQEQILQTLGPNNPIVTLAQYSNTIAKMVELGGFKNTGAFVTKLPGNFQLPPPQPQADPQAQVAEMLAQVEREKAQMKMQVDQAKLEADMQVKAAKLQLDREQMQADFARKQLELEMQAAKMQAELQMKEAQLVLQQLTSVQNGGQNEISNANEEAKQEANEARQEGLLAQAIQALGMMIAQTQAQTNQALTAPKTVIRDQSGRVVGVQTMGADNGDSIPPTV